MSTIILTEEVHDDPGVRSEAFRAEPVRSIIPCCRLWLLRILVRFRVSDNLFRCNDYREEELAEALGLPRPRRDEEEDAFVRRVHHSLRRQLSEAEKDEQMTRLPEILARNLDYLSTLVMLDETERMLLAFAMLCVEDQWLNEVCDWLKDVNNTRLNHILARILDLPAQSIGAALAPDSMLCRSGLLRIDSMLHALPHKFDLLTRNLGGLIHYPASRPEDFLGELITVPPPPELARGDYRHLEPHLRIVYPYLESALREGHVGVNILLYGPPGTGKTQLARVLARDLAVPLYEVQVEDEDGDSITGPARMRAYWAAQRILGNGQALLVFDEMEDLLEDGGLPIRRRGGFFADHSPGKGWFNRALESNPLPTVWISNSVNEIDAAILRRFDLVIEMPVPPASQRERLLRAEAPECVPEQTIRRLAQVESLSPAVAARAMRVVGAISDRLPGDACAGAIESLVEGTLRAQGHPGLAHYDGLAPPEGYDPALSNTEEDLSALCAGIRQAGQARLCLYGPPGTGKSAFARHVADVLDAPLLLRRASDLISPYVGMTERLIAEAFRQASREEAVLLIDEADSFLQDRREAQRSWEISQVNEMLTQMEAFPGVFIASTNLMEGLDRAALRRFDVKLCFDYLRPEQVWTLFRRTCHELGLGRPGASVRRRLADLHVLTPGDFATVKRRHRLRPLATPMDLACALERECAFKEEARRSPIGFVW